MNTYSPTKRDHIFLYALACFIITGIIAVFSASMPASKAITQNSSSTYYLLRYITMLFIGGCITSITCNITLKRWQSLATILLLINILIALITSIPYFSIGNIIQNILINNGWGNFNFFNIVIIFFVLFLANYSIQHITIYTPPEKIFFPIFFLLITITSLFIREMNWGLLCIILSVTLGMLLLSGIAPKTFLLSNWILTITVLLIISLSQHIWKEVLPIEKKEEINNPFYLTHSINAITRGGITGTGLGNSIEKIIYLPEPYTDFIFAIWAEELGLLGALFLMTLISIITIKCFMIGNQALQLHFIFPAFLSQSIGLLFFIQSVYHIAANIGWLPIRGIMLPMISYHGASIVTYAIAIGLVLRTDIENRQRIHYIQSRKNIPQNNFTSTTSLNVPPNKIPVKIS